MAKAENIAVAIALIGVVFVGAGFWLGERAPGPAVILLLLGGPLTLLGFGLLFVVGAVSFGRRALRALGVLPTPVEPAVPMPGWPGWRFIVDGIEHEIWVGDDGMTPRIVCDGRWVEPTRSDRTLAITVGRWPATITERVECDATVAGLPLTLLLGDTGPSLLMRYDLRIDGTLVPDDGRVVFRRDATP